MITKFIGEFTFPVMQNDSFSIFKYRAKEPVELPDGRLTEDITVKGYGLPDIKKVKYELTGNFEEYTSKYTGKIQYTFCASDVKELVPTEKDAAKAYLMTLKGVGKALAERMYDRFGQDVFTVMETTPEKLTEVNGVSKKKAARISADYLTRNQGHELFMYLFKYGVPPAKVAKIYNMLGFDAVRQVRENPFCILKVGGIGFKTADAIAKREGFPKDFRPRIESGIIEVLIQAEKGGSCFNPSTPLPGFMLDSFLRKPIFDLINTESTYTTGSVYISRDVAYLMTLKLLECPISEKDFDDICLDLHQDKRIFISIDRSLKDGDPEKVKIYKQDAAVAEYMSAKKIIELMSAPLSPCEDLTKNIYEVQKSLSIVLSDEQQKAVKVAMENPVSIITGGPGTGKTSVQKAILKTFSAYCPKEDIILAAPTGRAAKRMAESTGYPAATLHKVLGLYGDTDENVSQVEDDFMLPQGLIIVDETSMIGSFLLEKLLIHIANGSRLVLVGDIDQLPSIEVGAVLRELIDSHIVPVTRLTKTFRQASGSSIITNAARIKVGEKKLEYNSDFEFYADDTSEQISETVCSTVPRLIEEYGEDEVMVLTAYRKRTSSGANALNYALRDTLRKDITDETPYFEKQGVRIYEGDKVMNTKNSEFLTNGDIGKVLKVVKSKGSLIVTCQFDGEKTILEDDEVNSLELAYATTVHKSQGSEAKAVILVTDMAHRVMLKRNLFYTGVTRAKRKLIIVGQLKALTKSIDTVDSVYRKSQLGALIRRYAYIAADPEGYREQKEKAKGKKKEIKEEQIKMTY